MTASTGQSGRSDCSLQSDLDGQAHQPMACLGRADREDVDGTRRWWRRRPGVDERTSTVGLVLRESSAMAAATAATANANAALDRAVMLARSYMRISTGG
jgi:hypothetical protein